MSSVFNARWAEGEQILAEVAVDVDWPIEVVEDRDGIAVILEVRGHLQVNLNPEAPIQDTFHGTLRLTVQNPVLETLVALYATDVGGCIIKKVAMFYVRETGQVLIPILQQHHRQHGRPPNPQEIRAMLQATLHPAQIARLKHALRKRIASMVAQCLLGSAVGELFEVGDWFFPGDEDPNPRIP